MNALRALREKAGLTQRQLGKMMGKGQSAVAAWEAGVRMPRADRLPELARILGCKIGDLYAEQTRKAEGQ